MTLTDYYKGKKLTSAKSRFEIVSSTEGYDPFEKLLINKRKFNVGGHSFNCSQRSDDWKPNSTDMAITKGNSNITSIKRPDPLKNVGFGDINGTNDACIIVFNSDFKKVGITTIEIFIARGLKNDTNSIWDLFSDGELFYDVEVLKKSAIPKQLI